MSEDETLEAMATRIRARTTRRAGELPKTFDGKGNNQHKAGDHLTQKDAARSTGFSERQTKQAVRLANVPADQFESEVESDKPPSMSKLAHMDVKQLPRTLDGGQFMVVTAPQYLPTIDGSTVNRGKKGSVLTLFIKSQYIERVNEFPISAGISNLYAY